VTKHVYITRRAMHVDWVSLVKPSAPVSENKHLKTYNSSRVKLSERAYEHLVIFEKGLL
jgi:hypothetical protein